MTGVAVDKVGIYMRATNIEETKCYWVPKHVTEYNNPVMTMKYVPKNRACEISSITLLRPNPQWLINVSARASSYSFATCEALLRGSRKLAFEQNEFQKQARKVCNATPARKMNHTPDSLTGI